MNINRGGQDMLVVQTLLIAILTVTVNTQDPPANPVPDVCRAQLISYADWPTVAADDPAWSLQIPRSKGNGALLYFGAIHSRDPEHEQFSTIRRSWGEFRPTVAFYEGPDRGIRADERGTIAQLGESGYVRLLASRDGVKTERLEPDPNEEIAYLLERFTPEQVKLFFVIREAQRLRTAERLDDEEIRRRIAGLLERARALKGIGGVITTLEELDRAFSKYWGSPEKWSEAPNRWFDPLLSSSETGGVFTNDVNRASSEFRNLHMFQLLAAAALKGERVFAVVGRNHVPMQAPALRCALELPAAHLR